MDADSDLQSLRTRQKLITDRIRAVALHLSTGLYLYGRPGTSKTHTVCATLDGRGVDAIYHSGRLTSIGLFSLIAENADRVIVLDDISSIFCDTVAVELLLSALGNRNGVRQVRYKTARHDRTVTFSGGIIALSNLSLESHGAGLLHALNDRIPVIRYEPTDAEIVALMRHVAAQGIAEIAPEACQMVLEFLLTESQRREIRPSMRLLLDKAIPDYQLYCQGNSELDWRDLVVANLEQQLISPAHPLSDGNSDSRKQTEREIIQELMDRYSSRQERLQAWIERTGKSPATYYRRTKEF